MIDITCDFCSELDPHNGCRFRELYGEVLPSRLHYLDSEFVLFPTLGQILPNWFLFAPKRHVETMASLKTSERARAAQHLDGIASQLFKHTPYVLFEHGCTRVRGTGCGIYHAHIHVVPVPRPITARDILLEPGLPHVSLAESLCSLRRSSNYYVLRDSDGKVTSWNFDEDSSYKPTSQFFRMRIAALCGAPDPWDWKEYRDAEPRLIAAVRFAEA